MTSNTPTITAASLYFCEGNCGKENHIAVEPQGEGYIVTYAFVRRGSNLTTGTKTPLIVTLAQANALLDKLVREKSAKVYQPTGETKASYQQTGNEGQDNGRGWKILGDRRSVTSTIGNHQSKGFPNRMPSAWRATLVPISIKNPLKPDGYSRGSISASIECKCPDV
jgi:hypothetical protein